MTAEVEALKKQKELEFNEFKHKAAKELSNLKEMYES